MIKFKYFFQVKPLEKTIIFFSVVLVLIAIVEDMGFGVVPSFMYQQKRSIDIYHLLFNAQAAMVGTTLAIIAVLTGISDYKIYGISKRHFIMIIKQHPLFRYDVILASIILFTFIKWLSLAFELYNLSVVVFVITIIFILHLTWSLSKIMKSDKEVINEISDYISNSSGFEHISNVFQEMNDCMFSGNIVVLKRNYDFLMETLHEDKFPVDEEEAFNLLLSSINAARESKCSQSIKLLTLYITAFDFFSKNNNAISPSRLLNRYMFRLLSKTSVEDTDEIKTLINHWQISYIKSLASIKADEVYRWSNNFVASNLYKYLKDNANFDNEAIEEFAGRIITDAQFALRNDNAERILELNYIECIISFFVNKEKRLLEVLFGIDSRAVGYATISPIISNYRHDELTITNFFIIVYTYYIGYRESEGFVDADEKELCRYLLKEIASVFKKKLNIFLYNHVDSLKLDELFNASMNLMYQYERRMKLGHTSGVKSIIYDKVVRDFFVFMLSIKCHNLSTLEEKIGSFIADDHTSFLMSYSERSSISNFKIFYDIFYDGASEDKHEIMYDRLETAVANVYRERRLCEAKDADVNFKKIQSSYEQSIFDNLQPILEKFSSQFCKCEDEIKLQTFFVFSMREPTTSIQRKTATDELNDDNKFDVSHYASFFERRLEEIVILNVLENDKINKNEIDSTSKLKASDFMKLIAELNPNCITGWGRFDWDDEDYLSYKEMRSKCTEFEGYSDVHIALNLDLIKFNAENLSVASRILHQSEISDEISKGEVMAMNKVNIPISDVQAAEEYLRQYYRVIEVKVDIAIEFCEDVVGGGFVFANDKDSNDFLV